MKKLIFKIIIISSFVLLFTGLNTCTQEFNLEETLDGPEGKPLALIPGDAQVGINGTLNFSAEGGVPNYSFTVLQGNGTIDPVTGIYTAPSFITTEIITVTDSYKNIQSASIEIITGVVTNVNYEVSSVTNTGGTTGDAALDAEFLVTNIDTSNGAALINWTAYISDNGTADAGDIIANSGTIPAIGAGLDSGSVSISGTWPSSAGSYFIIVLISSPDDLTTADDERASGAISVSAPPIANIDYQVNSISNTNPQALAGSAVNESFTYRNTLGDIGGSIVRWTAYSSLDENIDGTDTIINSGTSPSLNGNTTSAPVGISGTWPAPAGAYYIIISINADDDVNPLNNSDYSSQFVLNALPGDIDYIVSEITDNFPIVTSNMAISEKFNLANIGGTAGGDDVLWTAYASTNTSLDVPGDIELGSGTALTGGLPAGGELQDISITGLWPSSPGIYYLFIDTSSTNEDITDNNSNYTGPFTVNNPPDYSVSSAVIQSDGTPGDLFSEEGEFSFIINNGPAAGDGTQSILWKMYRSFDNVYDTSDVLIKTGSTSAIPGNSNSTPQDFDDLSWPSYGSYYYIVITMSAPDEVFSFNNTYVHPTEVEVPESYTELLENNDGSGPAPANYTDLDLVLDGGNLDEFQLIKVNGVTDAPGAAPAGFDTYKFTLGPGATKIDFYAEWPGGIDALDLFLWDNSSTIRSSVSTDTATEPANTPSKNVGLSPGSVYYIGVQSNVGAVSYSLYISTRQ